jgi:hypothetical protein
MEDPLMDDNTRDALIAELSAELDMGIETIGALLDEAAALQIDLTDWGRYEERLPGMGPWSWHPHTLYHGGQTGLRVGQLILPPTVTGAKPADERATYAPGVYRRDRVYMVTDPEQARMFAALHPSGDAKRGGDVYRVQWLQGLERDRDCRTGGLSWQAPCARIVGIVATGVRRAPYEKALRGEIEAARAKEEPRRRLRAFTWAAPPL